jgi:hypothetical protein
VCVGSSIAGAASCTSNQPHTSFPFDPGQNNPFPPGVSRTTHFSFNGNAGDTLSFDAIPGPPGTSTINLIAVSNSATLATITVSTSAHYVLTAIDAAGFFLKFTNNTNVNQDYRIDCVAALAAGPTVTSISPTTGTTVGGTSVTITGTNLTGATAVTIGGVAATGLTVVNATTITATTPAHAAGAVDVAVTTPGGTGTGTGLYTYGAAGPTVTSISPTTGTTAGGTSVTITGTNLTGATVVTIGGVAATGLTVVNATTITATTPAHAAGAVDVAVTTPGGTGTGTGLYTYGAAGPTVASVSPNRGPTTGGTSVTITGTNLTGATSVKFGSTTAVSFTVNSATQITTRSPAAALGTVDVTVTTPAGTSTTSSGDQFTYAVLGDSLKLRAMQVAATLQVAQISGQAITGAIDNAIEDGFSDNPQPLTPNGSGFTFNFAAEPDGQRYVAVSNGARDFVNAPDRRASRIDDEFSALAYDGKITKAPPRLTAPQRDWLGWIDVRGTSFGQSSVGNDLKGNQINTTAGLTRKLTPDFLVGGFGGYEHFDYSSDALNGRLKGDGWTVGTYLGWRLPQSLRFDVAVAHSSIGYDDAAGTATGTFSGSRWLASSGLTGTYRWQALVLQPSARIYALWEHEGAYTDSLGTLQAERNFSTGRASAGTKVSYPFAWSATTSLTPYVGVYGDYYFSSDDAMTVGATAPPLLQGWSARVASGLAVKFEGGGQLAIAGELGGIGGNITIWTYRVRGTVPF